MSNVVLSKKNVFDFCFVFPFGFCTFIVRNIYIFAMYKCYTIDCTALAHSFMYAFLPAHSN